MEDATLTRAQYSAKSAQKYGSIALFMLFFGGVMMIFVLHDFFLSVGSSGWPETPGTVVQSHLISGTHRSRSAYVRYRYQVDGVPYTAQRIHFFLMTTPSSAADIVGRYPRGSLVSVRYNPNHPGTAILEPTPYAIALLDFMIALAFLMVWRWAGMKGKALAALAPPASAGPSADVESLEDQSPPSIIKE